MSLMWQIHICTDANRKHLMIIKFICWFEWNFIFSHSLESSVLLYWINANTFQFLLETNMDNNQKLLNENIHEYHYLVNIHK